MILLDENIVANQLRLLRSWRIRAVSVQEAFGRSGLSDSALLAVMRRAGYATFFSRDRDFFEPRLRDPRLCVVWLNVEQGESATFVRRALRHRALRTKRSRMGCVVRVAHVGLFVWKPKANEPEAIAWT